MPVISADQWNASIEKHKNCSLLQTVEWAALKSEFGWSHGYVLNDAAGALILFRSLPRWALGATIAYIPRGPVLLSADEAELKAFWEEVHHFCKSKKAIFLRVEPDAWEETQEAQILLHSMQGFRQGFSTIQPPRTILISLEGTEEDWLNRMNQKTRYNSRLSQKKELTVEIDGSIADFKALMDLTGDRDEFSVHSDAYYQRCYEVFRKNGKAYNLIAKYDGKPIAGLMLFIQGSRGYYLYGASSNEERNRMPNHLLQWTAMRLCAEHGCTEYDLWGIPDETPKVLESEFRVRHDGLWSVYRFKRGFGGEIKRTVGTHDKVYNALLYKLAEVVTRHRKRHD